MSKCAANSTVRKDKGEGKSQSRRKYHAQFVLNSKCLSTPHIFRILKRNEGSGSSHLRHPSFISFVCSLMHVLILKQYTEANMQLRPSPTNSCPWI